MRYHSLAKLILIPLLLCISFLAYADNSYSKIFIFGDSISDSGNLASVIGGIPAPYYKNRVSNGPVAVDTFTAKLGFNANPSLHLIGLNAGDNYSVAGAKASGNEGQDLDMQILAFQANYNFNAPEDALYVIFLGGNDVRAATYQTDPAIAESIIQTANNKIQNAINVLYQSGARSFLVINVPNIALIPETRLNAEASKNPALINRAADFSKMLNKKLHKTIEKIEDIKNINIKQFNLFKLFNKIVEKAAKFGFTNVTDACFSPVIPAFHPDCNNGLNADQFIFFDEIHPTTRVHTMFGEAFYKKINNDEDEEDKNDD